MVEGTTVVQSGRRALVGAFVMASLMMSLATSPVWAQCADGDGDGVCDVDDNCSTVANADQRDTYGASSGDGSGDACEPIDDDMNLTKVKVKAGPPAASKSRIAIRGDFVLLPGEQFLGTSGVAIRVVDNIALDETAPTAGTIACVSSSASVRCKGDTPLSSAVFKKSTTVGSDITIVRFSLKIAKIAFGGAFQEPVTVTLTDLATGIDRVGLITDCAAANGSLTCREF